MWFSSNAEKCLASHHWASSLTFPEDRFRTLFGGEFCEGKGAPIEWTAAVIHADILVDADNETAPDARRDQYFEYARLGIAERQPKNAAARSDFSYLGLRERYGLMRSREPLLPIDLVFQASPYDWSLGAFPRIREPKKTPDWFLFE